MTITTRIAASLLVAGFAFPALAQGTTTPVVVGTTTPVVKKPAVHSTLVHKVAVPDATKLDTGKPAALTKPVIGKTETVKPVVNTGIAKPTVPATMMPAPVVKTN